MIYQRRPITTAAPSTTPGSASVAPRRLEHDLSNNSSSSESLPLSDPVLEFGFTAEMSDATRRSIEAETKELASANAAARDEIAKENRVSQQLNTDLAHADAEMKSTKRKATELLETAGMQEHLLQPMGGTLQTEVVDPVLSLSTSLSNHGINKNQDGTNDTSEPVIIVSFHAVFDEHSTKAEEMKLHKVGLGRLHDKLCASEQAKQRMLRSTEGREEDFGKVQTTALESQGVLESEQKRKSKFEEVVFQTRSSATKRTDESEKLIAEAKCKKEANLAAAEELEKLEAEHQKECDDLIDEIRSKDAEQVQVNQEVEKNTRVLADSELCHKKSELVVLDSLKERQEISFFQTKQEEAGVQLAATTKEHDENEEILRDLTNAEAAFEAERLEQEKLHSEKDILYQTEVSELCKEKEKLTSFIDEMQEEIAAHKKKVDEAVANIKEVQEATEENLKTVQAEIKTMRLTRCEVEQDCEKSKVAVLSELEEIETPAKQMEETTEAEEKRLDDWNAKRAETLQARLIEVNEEVDREGEGAVNFLEALKFTKEFLKTTSREKEGILSTIS